MLRYGIASPRATDGESSGRTRAAISVALRWESRVRRLSFFGVLGLLLSIGLSTASISQQVKPLSVSVRVDTMKVYSFSPINLTLTTGIKKLFPTVQLQEYCLVAVTALYRVDAITTETFPFGAVSDTTYALSRRGTADSMVVSTRLEQRHVVTVQSTYYDLKWKKIATPERFLPDVPWFKIKPEVVK
jgi:hypothetical protein